ncbi:MAG: hypothetical protein F6J92_29475 [Symploca sp. SIO1A3]|nr:hypothetical protein [Symploca sp. SIO1A3]
MEQPNRNELTEEVLEFSLTEFLKTFTLELRDEDKDFDISVELFNHTIQEIHQWLEKI